MKELNGNLKKEYAGTGLSILNAFTIIIAFAYSIFLVSNYNRNSVLGGILTFGVLGLYLWRVYASIEEYKEGYMSQAKGVFVSIAGLFLLFIADFFVCANSIMFNMH